MKWIFKEVQPGDIIRIALGPIYHYGIYVSDDEIIQFGLPPVTLRRNEAEIEVCVTDIDGFLCGKFLEVAELDRKEKRKSRKPEKIIEIARSRIGERGYNLLHNNCEHFVNDCVFGKKYCSIEEKIRKMWRNIPMVDVYVAEYPFDYGDFEILPKERAEEIAQCSNTQVKQQKHYVWKLLEYGLEHSLGLKITDVKLTPAPEGGWQCDKCKISLSHSGSAVAVAISKSNVGVDIESCDRDFTPQLAGKILSPSEMNVYESLASDMQQDFLLQQWTKKEALFKQSEQKGFSPSKTEVIDKKFYGCHVIFNGNEYMLSVATDTPEKVKLFIPFGGMSCEI